MTDIVCIAGLPGSGKTVLANVFLTVLDQCKIVDDITDLSQLEKLGDIYNTIVIVDPWFCDKDVRDNANVYLSLRYNSVSWRFFANDPDACRRNVAARNDGRLVDDLITQLSKIYTIPDGVNQIPVHSLGAHQMTFQDINRLSWTSE